MTLETGIQQYTEEKRAAGMRFDKSEKTLLAFRNRVGNLSLASIRTQNVETFLDLPNTTDRAWVRKYNLLRAFFAFWAARDLIQSLPMPQPRRAAKNVSVPYIYSLGEIRRLVQSTRLSQAHGECCIDRPTLRAYLLFLYGVGASVGESIRLLRSDVDLKRQLVTLRNYRMEPTRTIPFGSDLHEVLRSYCPSRGRGLGREHPLFVSKNGQGLKIPTLDGTFVRLRELAGITRHDGVARAPRLHDLRFTFAVHRLTAWHRHGADLNRMIPALSVYMGYGNLSGAARFLIFTPERFRGQLNKLSPRQAKRHWRDDPKLMQFLSTL